MSGPLREFLRTEISNLEQAGLLHTPAVFGGPPGPTAVLGDRELIDLTCADYLGLSTHAEVRRAAKAAIDAWGAGRGAPRAAGGTCPLHVELEGALSQWLGTEDALVFSSGTAANAALFESLCTERDYVFCDEQAHPTLVDGIRLSRARVFPFRNGDMDHLEDRLKRSRAARFRFIVTDAVYPLRGVVADLRALYELARRYEALAVVDDSQGIGVLGPNGRGSHEAHGILRDIDVVTGTFGYALGTSGGFVTGRREVIEWLRQKARPHLVSSAAAPGQVAAAQAALRLAAEAGDLRERLEANRALVREGLDAAGLEVVGGAHPILAVVVGEALRTQQMADGLYREGVLAVGFCHPVVPEGTARLRLQVTARHSQKSLRAAVDALAKVARECGLV